MGIREDAITPDAPFRQAAPAPGAERPFVMPQVREERLANGLRILLVEDHTIPVVAFSVAISRGSAAAAPGLANLVRYLLADGTEIRDALHLARAFYSIGARRWGSTQHDLFKLEYVVLPSGVEELIMLVAEILRQPDPPQSEFERTRDWSVSDLRTQSPSERMEEVVLATLYPKGHPYRLQPGGTIESIGKLQKADALAFLKDHVAPDQIVIVAAGDVSWSTFSDSVTARFADWRRAAIPEPALPDVTPLDGDAPIVIVDRPGAGQAEIQIVAFGSRDDSPDADPLRLLADVLGGNFTSRILHNLREQHGYSYSPDASIYFERGPGILTTTARVPTNRVTEALNEMNRELNRIRSEDVTPAELDLARSARIAGYQAAFSTRSAMAGTLSSLVVRHRPVDDYVQSSRRIANVTAAELRDVAQRYLDPKQRRVLILGDANAIRKQLPRRQIETVPLRRD